MSTLLSSAVAPLKSPASTPSSTSELDPTLIAVATALPSAPLPLSPTRAPDSPTAEPLCHQPGQIVAGVYPSHWNGESRYRIYLPPCYGVDEQLYPTLYLLPGNIHDDSIWETLGVGVSAEILINQSAIAPLLIVMADAGNLYTNTSGDTGSYESQILDDLIPYVEATYSARPERSGRAIGGLSRGGYWALEIAFRHPERFASVGGHSAALVDNYVGPELNPQFTGTTLPLGDLRVLLDIGENDGYRPQLEQLHNDMAEANVVHDWTLNPGMHNEAYWSGNLAAYLRWYAEGWGGVKSEG